MLRLQIFNQASRITLISIARKETTLLKETNNFNKVQRKTQVFFQQSIRNIIISSQLQKYNRKSGVQNTDTDSDDEEVPQFKDERDSKVVKTKVNSLRADLLLKAGLGIARNKIETIFYESRIRVNGEKIAKKSVQLNEGDEIDVIRGFSQQNPCHLVISRVIILDSSEREEGYSVTLRRYKVLLVENYSGSNAFKSSSVAGNEKLS